MRTIKVNNDDYQVLIDSLIQRQCRLYDSMLHYAQYYPDDLYLIQAKYDNIEALINRLTIQSEPDNG